jgi:hypothetical protein
VLYTCNTPIGKKLPFSAWLHTFLAPAPPSSSLPATQFVNEINTSVRSQSWIVQSCMIKWLPATIPVPVIRRPTSSSSASSRNALPPLRLSTYSSPSSVRRTTATRLLFEPGAIRARFTVPVICRCLGFILFSDVFRHSNNTVVMRVRDKNASLRQHLPAAGLFARSRPMLGNHHDLLRHATRLHLLPVA